MKRLPVLFLASVLGTSLVGCAGSSVATSTSVLVASRGASPTVASGSERDVRTSALPPMDIARTPEGPREGIPLPEPALPPRDIQLAGPTPQIPIPRGGGLASPVE